MNNMEHNAGFFNDYHAQIDGVGSKFCSGMEPNCSKCSLESVCKKSDWTIEKERGT
ncbi:MAG TPA: hypothetical protein PLA01_08530 [Acetivibrio sp.]|nr:hypothetical protein [Acetivibrio sp.]